MDTGKGKTGLQKHWVVVDLGMRLALQVGRARPGCRHHFIVNALYFERSAKCFMSPNTFYSGPRVTDIHIAITNEKSQFLAKKPITLQCSPPQM